MLGQIDLVLNHQCHVAVVEPEGLLRVILTSRKSKADNEVSCATGAKQTPPHRAMERLCKAVADKTALQGAEASISYLGSAMKTVWEVLS